MLWQLVNSLLMPTDALCLTCKLQLCSVAQHMFDHTGAERWFSYALGLV